MVCWMDGWMLFTLQVTKLLWEYIKGNGLQNPNVSERASLGSQISGGRRMSLMVLLRASSLVVLCRTSGRSCVTDR